MAPYAISIDYITFYKAYSLLLRNKTRFMTVQKSQKRPKYLKFNIEKQRDFLKNLDIRPKGKIYISKFVNSG